MSAPATPPPAAWQTLAAEDLRALAWLHAEERPPEVLAALYASGFPATLTVVSADAAEAQAMDAALRALAEQPLRGRRAGCAAGLQHRRAGRRLRRHLPHPRAARLATRIGVA